MKLILKIYNWIIRRRQINRAKEACKMADEMHQIDGKRYIVIIWNGKYMVMNNNDRKLINKTMPKNQRLSFVQLMANKVYATP